MNLAQLKECQDAGTGCVLIDMLGEVGQVLLQSISMVCRTIAPSEWLQAYKTLFPGWGVAKRAHERHEL